MSDESIERQSPATAQQQAYSEAAERERRLEVWLKGMLAGVPSTPDAVERWREGVPKQGGALECSPGEDDDSPEAKYKLLEDSLAGIRRRLRERREESGKPAREMAGEECLRRVAEMKASMGADLASGKEPTPLHLVLAARYIEGEIDFEEYSRAIAHL